MQWLCRKNQASKDLRRATNNFNTSWKQFISLYGWKLDKQMVWDELKRLNSLENTPTNTHILEDGSIWGDSVRSKKIIWHIEFVRQGKS